MLNVNREGTGGSILCPNSFNQLRPSILGDPPEATITLSNFFDFLEFLKLSCIIFFKTIIFSTLTPISMEIEFFLISLNKQSIMD